MLLASGYEASMKRLLIFGALFPPLALVVFTAPDGFKNLLDWMVMAYAIAVIPAFLLAWVDWALSAKPLRVMGTAVTAAVSAILIVRFMSGRSDDLWPVLMVGLVGGVPAGVCSWLSDKSMRSKKCVSDTEPRKSLEARC
jgi:hypothetical protein